MSLLKFAAAAVAAAVLLSSPAKALPAGPTATEATLTTPWVGVVFSGMAVSVLLNGAIVSATQCRELTAQEAYNSILLPFIGIALNNQASLCGKKKKR